MKKNNKGFTLVELIVVLVILAILAAILVPALLGYIDQAKSKQTVLNAKSALTAAQAEMSNIYATKNELPSAIESEAHAKNIAATADFKSLGVTNDSKHKFEVGCDEATVATDDKKEKHKAYTITWAHYKDDSGELWFNGSEWVEKEPTTAPASGKFQIFPVK